MNKYIRHYSEILEKMDLNKIKNNRISFSDADFGRKLGLSRLGLHHIIIPPQCRTSLPHAESSEEEFIFVISGSPQVWINGNLYQLIPQDMVSFPAGTGIAHNLINNSEEDAHIFVIGERTKLENQYFYPLNPEMKLDCKMWWNEYPIHKIGNHDGMPQKFSASKLEVKMFSDRFESIRNIIEVPVRPSISYPGDTEIFSSGRKIGNDLGLKKLGIWHEVLEPGRRTSWPHAHLKEEEFVYVLSGNPQLWLHGHLYQLKSGDGVAFPAGIGLAHTLLNNSNQDCEILVVGESGIEDDQIFYPEHPLRNGECREHGWLWENHPVIRLGND